MHLHEIVKVNAFASTDVDPGWPCSRHGRAMTPPVIGIGTPVVAG
jgi:hypothetical protein